MSSEKTPELDGIRGVAVLMVLFYHCVTFDAWTIADRILVKGIGFGWAGVDLFFALSGFLITGILFDAKGKAGYFVNFFGRRTLRIFPLYFCFLAGLAVWAYLIDPGSVKSTKYLEVQEWHWLYAVNFLLAHSGDWDVSGLPTGHLWSLAIEEQFYLLWPLIVWKLSRERLLQVCAGVIVAALALRFGLRLNGADPITVYVLTPTRVDALLFGSFAALLIRGPSTVVELKNYAKASLIAGGVTTAIAMGIHQTTGSGTPSMQTVGFTGTGLLSAGLILTAWTANRDSLVRVVLRTPALLFFGAYSYALYVLHLVALAIVTPLFPVIETLPTVAGFLFPWALVRGLCAIGLAVLMALATWHLIEKRCLSLKHYFSDARPQTPIIVPRPSLSE